MSVHIYNIAQRVRNPNGTTSEPFIAAMSKADMVGFARMVLEKQWPQPTCRCDRLRFRDGDHDEHCAQGVWVKQYGHDACTCRIDCVYDGRFWATLEQWCSVVPETIGPVGNRERVDGCLSRGELLVTFPQARSAESYWSICGMGVDDPHVAIARTTLKWAPVIEEWG